jgi:S1-C subfamily serine protease
LASPYGNYAQPQEPKQVGPGKEPTTAPTTARGTEKLTAEKLFALASPAVVKLIVKDEDGREIGQGSGFVFAVEQADHEVQGRPVYKSTIVTNYHVILPAVEVDVLFQSEDRGWVSDIAGGDESPDLAVLIAKSFTKPSATLELNDGSTPAVGTKVYTIGSPLGLGNTLSEGLVSGYRDRSDRTHWIQITAPISSGSSGGPLLSSNGSVLGITTATMREGQNLNFAIPAKVVVPLLQRNAREAVLYWR